MYWLFLSRDRRSLDLPGCIYLQESITKLSQVSLKQQLAVHCAAKKTTWAAWRPKDTREIKQLLHRTLSSKPLPVSFRPNPPVPSSFPRRVCDFCWLCTSTSQSLTILLRMWLKLSAPSLANVLCHLCGTLLLTHLCLLVPQWPHGTGFNAAHEQ